MLADDSELPRWLLPRAHAAVARVAHHEPLVEQCAESGLVAIEVLAPPTASDIHQLTDVIRGAAPPATPIATVRVNHVTPAVHGVDTSALVRGAAAQLATVFMRGALDRIADGGTLDGGAVRRR